MAAPRLERIRACLRCGALMTFSALRCGACGAAAAGVAASERVRPCLQCGVILRFDQDPCPQCGARAKEDEDGDRVKSCDACGELIAFAALYCPRCHELSVPIATDSIPPDVAIESPIRLGDRLPGVVAALAFASGIAALAVALVEILA